MTLNRQLEIFDKQVYKSYKLAIALQQDATGILLVCRRKTFFSKYVSHRKGYRVLSGLLVQVVELRHQYRWHKGVFQYSIQDE